MEKGLMKAEFKQQERGNGCGASRRNPGILIADDMALNLTLLKVEMESRGFTTWLAVDGDDAIDLYRKHRDEIDLVLLDVQMPGTDGPQTLEALRRLNPVVVACFMTGGGGIYTEEDLRDRGAAWVFWKPFRPADVANILQNMVSTPNSTPFVCDWQTHHEDQWSHRSGKANALRAHCDIRPGCEGHPPSNPKEVADGIAT
jgi:CheY-like chemotaxis protein